MRGGSRNGQLKTHRSILLRIAFGTSILRRQRATGQLDGIGRYAEELLAALQSIPEFTVREYVHPDIARAAAPAALDAGSFLQQAAAAFAFSVPFRRMEQVAGASFDLVHASDHFIPKLRHVPVVATIHDIVPLSHPEWNRYRFPRLKAMLWQRSIGWARHIVTVSESAKRDIEQWCGVDANRISVTPLGVGPEWFREADHDEIRRVRGHYGLAEKYFLFLGVIQPRKNIGRLLDAHRQLPADLRRTVPLVTAGPPGWGCAQEEAALAAGEAGALRNIGPIAEPDLVPLVQSATALVLPSLHEGFGLPVLEAMAAGTSVIASNAGALPEVAGDAAILVDSLDVGALAETLRRVATDQTLQESLREHGRARARQFTWSRTAARTAEIYRSILTNPMN
jgi:glycosyltransferase involved in cell wall biosynthesis